MACLPRCDEAPLIICGEWMPVGSVTKRGLELIWQCEGVSYRLVRDPIGNLYLVLKDTRLRRQNLHIKLVSAARLQLYMRARNWHIDGGKRSSRHGAVDRNAVWLYMIVELRTTDPYIERIGVRFNAINDNGNLINNDGKSPIPLAIIHL